MKILAYTQQDVWSGDLISLHRLLAGLKRNGAEITVLALAPKHVWSRFEDIAEVIALDKKFDFERLSFPLQKAGIVAKIFGLARFYLRVPSARRAIDKHIKSIKPDAMIVNNAAHPGSLSCQIALAAAVEQGVPRIAYLFHNNSPIPMGTLATKLQTKLLAAFSSDSVEAVTFSNSTLDEFKTALAGQPAKARSLFYSIPDTAQQASAGKKSLSETAKEFCPKGEALVVCAGRLEERKGIHILLEAWDSVSKEIPSAKLAIVGDGPRREELEGIAKERGFDSSVIFTGFRDDVSSILAVSDFLVLPSLRQECSPLVVIEAMAAGKPVLASRLAGTPERIEDGQSGLLVPPGNADELANALKKLLGNPELRAKMGQRGRQRWEKNHKPEEAVKTFEEILGVAGSKNQ